MRLTFWVQLECNEVVQFITGCVLDITIKNQVLKLVKAVVASTRITRCYVCLAMFWVVEHPWFFVPIVKPKVQTLFPDIHLVVSDEAFVFYVHLYALQKVKLPCSILLVE